VESKTVSTKDREKYDEELKQTKDGTTISSLPFISIHALL
jgi:hypothetical protein